MIAIGIDTSGRQGSVALLRDDNCLGERALSRTGRRHARTLVLELQQLLLSARIAPEQVDVVAVSVGPGSFTGLRVGMVCGKTMAYAIGARLVGVGTFVAIAHNAPVGVTDQFVIGDAQRGDLYVARYRVADGHWLAAEDGIRIVRFKSWRDALPADTVLSGPGVDVYRAELEGRAQLLSHDCWTFAASQVARIGQQRAADGISDDPFLIEPVYLRRSSAEEKLDSNSRLPVEDHDVDERSV